VKPPNVLVSTTTSKFLPSCWFENPNLTVACKMKGMSASQTASYLQQSLFSVHVKGDDASSSRLYEAVANGALSIVLAIV